MDMLGQNNDRVYREWMASLDLPERRAKQFDVINEKSFAAIRKIDREKER